MSQHERTEMMLGKDGLLRLKKARVAVFGVGGVGGFAAEALARAGIGKIDLIDSDRVSLSNVNRQIIATHRTLGMLKVDAMRERIAEINPDAQVNSFPIFFSENTADSINFADYDYVIDAIDSVGAKLDLITLAKEAGAPIISAMGAGGKLDPTAFRVSDISKTTVCPLARAVRLGLRKRGIHHLRVVYSTEPPFSPLGEAPIEDSNGSEPKSPTEKRNPPASISFVPSVMGLILAGEVIKDIAGVKA